MTKKITLRNLTGQDLIVGFVDGKNKKEPKEPVIIEAHGEKTFDEKVAKAIMAETHNVVPKEPVKKPKAKK